MPVVDFSLTDQIAFVTGASRGIGEAIARGFAEQGATVVLASRKQEGLDRIAESIRADGGKAVPIAVTPATWSRSRPCSTASRASSGGRHGQPNEIAGAAVFLASKAGSSMTGATIVMDEGSSA